jgi:hypothetical protein
MATEAENTAPKKPRGRPRGSVNRRSQMARDIVERLNCDPLEGLLRIAKNKRLAIELRLDAMKAAVPFVHARLSTTFVSGRVESNVSVRHQLQAIMMDPELSAAAQMLSLAFSAQPAPNVIDVEPLALVEPEDEDAVPKS